MPETPKPITATRAKRIRDWLKARGHQPGRVDGFVLKDEGDVKVMIREIHGITPEQWRMAGGRPAPGQ